MLDSDQPEIVNAGILKFLMQNQQFEKEPHDLQHAVWLAKAFFTARLPKVDVGMNRVDHEMFCHLSNSSTTTSKAFSLARA
jgi:hypothetical protein